MSVLLLSNIQNHWLNLLKIVGESGGKPDTNIPQCEQSKIGFSMRYFLLSKKYERNFEKFYEVFW